MWLDLGLAILVGIATVTIPGALLILAVGLRGRWLVGLAIPAGMTVITLASLVAGFFGLAWSMVPVLLVTIALLVVILLVRSLLWRHAGRFLDDPSINPRWYAIALTGAALIIALQFFVVMRSPENISQTFDNIFHLNALRYILDTANASPLWVGTMTNPNGALGFYPSGWHAFGSLVAQMSGVAIPVVSNAVMTIFGAIAWPVSMFLLASVLVKPRIAGLIAIGAAVSGIAAFPLYMITYGVLYPYMAAVAMIPAALALVMAAVMGSKIPLAALIITFLGVLPGIAITHPGAFVALLAFTTVGLAFGFVRVWRMFTKPAARAAWIALALVYLGIVAACWYALRPIPEARTWLTDQSAAQTVGEIALLAVGGAEINYLFAALVIAAIVMVVRSRDLGGWISACLLVAGSFLYIMVSSGSDQFWRDLFTGGWYNNAPRLAALLPIAWVPLIGYSGQRIADSVLARMERSPSERRMSPRTAALVMAAIVVIVPQLNQMSNSVLGSRQLYAYSAKAPLLTADEHALIMRLDTIVPEGERIAGSSWTGAGLAYALADRPVVMTHTLMEITPDIELINTELDEAEPGSAVCEAVNRLDVHYVLDFGKREVNNSNNPMPGFDQLASSPAVELVDHEGRAKLYRVIACG